MNKLLELIDKRIAQKMSEGQFLIAVPCVVLEILSNGKVKVKAMTSGSIMNVPNYSGSEVAVGEAVQLFHSGVIMTESNSYIGASLTKGSGFVRLTGTTFNRVIGSTESIFANIGVKCNGTANVVLILNANVYGNESGNLSIKVYVDDVAETFSLQQYITLDEYEFVPLTMALVLTNGEHTINVTGAGSGSITSSEISVVGTNIEAYNPYTPTTDDDYIYAITNNEVYIRHYIGTVTNPSVPETIEGKPVKYIEPTAFNYTTVERVYIPDGVQWIG